MERYTNDFKPQKGDVVKVLNKYGSLMHGDIFDVVGQDIFITYHDGWSHVTKIFKEEKIWFVSEKKCSFWWQFWK